MADQPLGFFDYVKAAFNQEVNFPGLGHLPLNKILLGTGFVLGLANPGFWFLTLGLEVLYLWGMSSNPNYQKLVAISKKQVKDEAWEQKQYSLLSNLDQDSRGRYHRLLDKCAAIIKISGTEKNKIYDYQSAGLNQLVWMFLKLLSSRRKMENMLSGTSRETVENEIRDLSAKIANEPEGSALQRSMQGTLEIQKRRLENLIKAKENLRVVEAELDRIEKQVTLLNEEASVTSDPDLLSVRLDNVMTSLSSTSQWMSEQGDMFGEDISMPKNLLNRSIQERQKEI